MYVSNLWNDIICSSGGGGGARALPVAIIIFTKVSQEYKSFIPDTYSSASCAPPFRTRALEKEGIKYAIPISIKDTQ